MAPVDGPHRRLLLSPERRDRLRKLVDALASDLIDERRTYAEFQACRETVRALLDEYESAPERQAEARSFSAWLVRHEGEQTAIGDFASDWSKDRGRPEPTTLAALVEYLEMANGSDAAIDAARSAWRSYATWLRADDAG